MSVSGKTVSDLIRETLDESEESAKIYLVESWIANASSALRAARRKAGLTQQEMADRLGTTQSSVARLEADDEGRVTLRRYLNYLAAAGYHPFDVETVPFTEARAFVHADPQQLLTAITFPVATNAPVVAEEARSVVTQQATSEREAVAPAPHHD